MSTNWTALLAESEALRQRLARLETKLSARRARRARLGLAVMLLGVALFGGGGQPPTFADAQPGVAPAAQPAGKPAEDIVCSSLRMVGADGKVRLSLGYDAISGFVKLHGPDGNVRAALWCDDKSRFGQADFLDATGKSRVSLFGTDRGGAATFANGGPQHVFVGSAPLQDGGVLSVLGPQGKTVVHLGHDPEGGLVFVNGHDGGARATLWVAKGGQTGLLNLHDSAGKSRANLGIDAHGGFLDLIGKNDKTQVMLDCHTQHGGGLRLFTSQGVALFQLGGHAKSSHGHLQLGPNGQAGVDLFVNADGEGMVWGIDGANQVTRWLK